MKFVKPQTFLKRVTTQDEAHASDRQQDYPVSASGSGAVLRQNSYPVVVAGSRESALLSLMVLRVLQIEQSKDLLLR